jgi:hypothetical protein
MQRSSTEVGAAAEDSTFQFHKQSDEDGANRDDTTLAFDGLMKVSADEAGGDPYNRIGSFRRLVR